jgi:hypothetical protein
MNSRDPSGLHPEARELYERWMTESVAAGLWPLAYCFARSPEDQARLFRTNRSRAEVETAASYLFDHGLAQYAAVLERVGPQPNLGTKSPTNALPGLSFHQPHALRGFVGALAWDWVPTFGGKALWKAAEEYRTGGEIAERMGLTWSGRWRGDLRETAHIQLDDRGEIDKWALARGELA